MKKENEDPYGLKEMFEQGKKTNAEGLEREKKKRFPAIETKVMRKIEELGDREKATLLAMTMESIRGSWRGIAEAPSEQKRLAMVFYLARNTRHLPKPLAKAIEHNAYMYDGEWCDGRVFRDGSRRFGMSGNLAFWLTGDDRIFRDGFCGTYYELWKLVGGTKDGRPSKNLVPMMKEVYPILAQTGEDLTWDKDMYWPG